MKKLGIAIFIVFIINILSSQVRWAWDLTEDKRYTLAEATEEVIAGLDNPVQVKVFMKGDFPADFKKLQNGITEKLADFQAISAYVDYTFVDPLEGDEDEVAYHKEQLQRAGISPVRLQVNENGTRSEKYIFPAALIQQGDKAVAVNLLDNDIPGMQRELIINNSVGQIEYRIANAIQKVSQENIPMVAFLKGRGMIADQNLRAIRNELGKYYLVGDLEIDKLDIIDPKVDVLIIPRPTQSFTENDNFAIDQYIMNGGSVLWLVDRLAASIDSMRTAPKYMPFDYPLNIENLLYKYGVRIQPNIIADLECSPIPQVVGMQGDAPQFELFPWYFHPTVRPASQHPIVNNLDRIDMKFVSSMDTIRTKTPVKKTILLETSERTKPLFMPVELNFELLREELAPELFKEKHMPVAVLLEGIFPSVYVFTAKSEQKTLLANRGLKLQSQSQPTKMIVVSDGDMIANDIERQTGEVIPLGYNQFSRYRYANKDFILNAIEYLAGNDKLLSVRNKEVKLRLLNKVKVKAEKSYWQWLNVGLPLVFLALFGMGFHFWRKRRYA